MNIDELVGKRALLKVASGGYKGSEVTEYRILEISPSGLWVKLMNLNGHKFWKSLSEIAFVEELRELKPPYKELNS
jgi:hypothetical protein